jgi:hypothetical protein
MNTATPAPQGQSTGLIAISDTGPGAPGGSGQTWTNVFQDVVKGLFSPGGRPSTLNRAPASSSTSTETVLLVGGGIAVVGLVAYLLMRRS